MNPDRFAEISQKKLNQIDDLKDLSLEASQFKAWLSTTEQLIAAAFGEKSRQFDEFRTINYIPLTYLETTPAEDRTAYNQGLEDARVFLLAQQENVETFGLTLSSTSEPSAESLGLTQNFYLSQSQAQTVRNDIDLGSLDLEVREKLEELLAELEKKSNKDKSKIASSIKWLADRSIDVLIALIAAAK